MSYRTGYFGRPSDNGLSAKWTFVHVVKDGKPICGYKPHPTMSFQFNADYIKYDYIECKKCKEKANKLLYSNKNNKENNFS
jgi:hypothetical protein